MKTDKIQNNLNTLFLRNIETVLISEGVIPLYYKNLFRKNVAPHLLDLIKRYVDDIQNDDSQRLKSQYIDDCIAFCKYYENTSHK